jgi:hypothetical protein
MDYPFHPSREFTLRQADEKSQSNYRIFGDSNFKNIKHVNDKLHCKHFLQIIYVALSN